MVPYCTCQESSLTPLTFTLYLTLSIMFHIYITLCNYALQPVPTSHNTPSKLHLSKDLPMCTHVFIHRDVVCNSVQPPYDGLFKFLKCAFVFLVNDQYQTIALDHLKPAHLNLQLASPIPQPSSSSAPHPHTHTHCQCKSLCCVLWRITLIIYRLCGVLLLVIVLTCSPTKDCVYLIYGYIFTCAVI